MCFLLIINFVGEKTAGNTANDVGKDFDPKNTFGALLANIWKHLAATPQKK